MHFQDGMELTTDRYLGLNRIFFKENRTLLQELVHIEVDGS